MMKSIKKIFFAIIMLTITVYGAQAQQYGGGGAPEPCSGNPDSGNYDPNNCPLDSWVLIIAVIALVAAVIHLQRNNKLLAA